MVKLAIFHKSEFSYDMNSFVGKVNGELSRLKVSDEDIISIGWHGDYMGVWFRASKAEEAAKRDVDGGHPQQTEPKMPGFTDWSVFASSQGFSPAQAHEVFGWFAMHIGRR